MPAYKPERAVTSEKIRKEIYRLSLDGGKYVRLFRSKIVVSRNNIRGYSAAGATQQVVAISDPDDKKLLSIYAVDDARKHAISLGLDEVLASE